MNLIKIVSSLLLSMILSINCLAQENQAGQASSSDEEQSKMEPKVLIVYYTCTHHMQQIAQFIHEAVVSDMFELQTVQAYP